MSLSPLYFLAGYVLFRVLTQFLVTDKAQRSVWNTRVATALVASLLLWKLTPLYTRWNLVLDNPLLLLYMNGGLAATAGAASMGITIVAVGFWQLHKTFTTHVVRLALPLVAGSVLVAGLFLAEPLWTLKPPVSADASQLLAATLDGPKTALVEGRGQVLVVNFWGTWCPPCKAELPDLQEFQTASPTGIALWGVNLLGTEPGGRTAVEAYVKDHAMTWKQLLDDQGALQRAYDVTVVPTTLVFDPEGRLVERRIGAVDVAWLRGLAGRYGH